MIPSHDAVSVCLTLAKQHVLIVGAGPVARRKISKITTSNALIKIVSPGPDGFEAWLNETRLRSPSLEISWERRLFAPDDLQDVALVFACTNDAAVNARIAALARERQIWSSVADDPNLGDFTLSSSTMAGPLLFGVSSNRTAPALARLAREHLQLSFGAEWQQVAHITSDARRSLKSSTNELSRRTRKLRELSRSQLLHLLRVGQHQAAQRLIQSILGLPAASSHDIGDIGDIGDIEDRGVIVISAFGPFPGVALNPTGEVALKLLTLSEASRAQSMSPAIEIVTLPTLFDHAWDRLHDTIEPLRAAGRLRGVISLGVATRSQQIAIERIGINYRASSRPDAAGRLLPISGEAITPGGPHGLMSRLAVDTLAANLSTRGLPVTVSNSAGTYVCNEVMYRLLSWSNRHMFDGFAGFVHIPPVPEALSLNTVVDILSQLIDEQHMCCPDS